MSTLKTNTIIPVSGGILSVSGGLSAGGGVNVGGTLGIGTASMSVPSGTAPLFAVRAWGSVTSSGGLSYGGNIASVSGVSPTTVTFNTSMPDVNYAVVAVNNGNGDFHARPHNLSAGSFQITVTNNGAGFFFMVIR